VAFTELFVCDTCAHDEVLVHAEEWTPGPGGEPLPYPGHGPVGGLANRLWCPSCRRVRAFPFVRLNPPGDHAVIAYAEAQRLGCDGTETGPCPACAAPLTWDLDGAPCPACPRGTLRFTGEWEDAV
jgi:hypothetical protein